VEVASIGGEGSPVLPRRPESVNNRPGNGALSGLGHASRAGSGRRSPPGPAGTSRIGPMGGKPDASLAT